jgi:hypothetical protein
MQEGSSTTGRPPVQVAVKLLVVKSWATAPMMFPSPFWSDMVTMPPPVMMGRMLPLMVKQVMVAFFTVIDPLKDLSMPMISLTPFE